MTILILTSRDDLTADAVIDELNHRGADVARFDTADFPTGSRLAATLTGGGWAGTLTTTSGRSIDLAAVTAVWWRRPAEFSTPDDWEPSDRAWAVSEARAGLLGVLGSLDVRWVNHPAAEAAANYKPHQLATAARVGLDVPDTIVTSAPDHAHTFITDGGNPVIYKPLGGGVLRPDSTRTYLPVTLVDTGDLDEGVTGTAHLFQQRVDKAYEVRLTVVGDRMFPVAIHADSDAARHDWRTDYASLTYQSVELPENVRTGVRRLMDELGLFFGALDFAIDTDGRWCFLEINPNGQWHWIAVKANVPLVQAMADALDHQHPPPDQKADDDA